MSSIEKNFFKDRQEDLAVLITAEKVSFYEHIDYFLGTSNMPLILNVLESVKSANSENANIFERTRRELSDVWYKYLAHKSELESLEKWVINTDHVNQGIQDNKAERLAAINIGKDGK